MKDKEEGRQVTKNRQWAARWTTQMLVVASAMKSAAAMNSLCVPPLPQTSPTRTGRRRRLRRDEMKPSDVSICWAKHHDSKDSARRETANRQGMAKTSAKRHDAGYRNFAAGESG
jgi:hypothetical protein